MWFFTYFISYVHAVAGTKTHYRICGRNVRDPGAKLYFDIQDCFDNLYKKVPNLRKSAEKTMLDDERTRD